MARLDHLGQDLMQKGFAVAVVGGGCAGLAAAATLAEEGLPVTIFEASHQLGGRARGVGWKGLMLDNGQHILLGAYAQTLKILQLAGIDAESVLLRTPLRLHMQNELTITAPSFLPAPLHILSAFLFGSGLSFGERYAALRFMAWLKIRNFTLAKDEPLLDFLGRKQPERLVRLIWEPLCLAALNTPLAEASAQVFLNVLRDSFSRKKSDSDMLLPRSDLSELLAHPLAAFIERKGGKIRLNSAANRIHKTTGGYAIELESGEHEEYSHVIVAVQPFRVMRMLGGIPELQSSLEAITSLKYQPIYTVYLQYPQSVRLQQPMIGLAKPVEAADYYSQWVFDRGLLCGQAGLLAVIVSAEGSHQALTQEALAQKVAEELQAVFPGLGLPLWHKVIAEKRATFACKAGMQRPLQKTGLPRLFLSGDYCTDGHPANMYPATIEGAVRSGVQCAKYIIEESRK